VVADESHVHQQGYASPAVRRNALQNRDIIRMFDGLSVSESFLLRNGLREILFRKHVAGCPGGKTRSATEECGESLRARRSGRPVVANGERTPD
jgi:hypothetical protein